MSEQPRVPAPEGSAWVSVEEAVPILGVSASTIRRRIENGTLEGYRVERAQGSGFSWSVLVELSHLAAAAAASDALADASDAVSAPTPDASAPADETPTEIQQIFTLSEHPDLLALVREVLLAPLERQYRALQEQLDRRTDALLVSRELLGRQDVTIRQLEATLREQAGTAQRATELADELRQVILLERQRRVEVEQQLADALMVLAERAVAAETAPDVSAHPGALQALPARVRGWMKTLAQTLGYA